MLRDGQFTVIESPRRSLALGEESQRPSDEELNSPDFDFDGFFYRQAVVVAKNPRTQSEFVVTPKTGTYSNKDLMIMALGKDRPVHFGSLQESDGRYYFGLIREIVDVLEGDNDVSNIIVGTNINPEETQLKTAQSIKSLHTHIVGYPKEAFPEGQSKPLHEAIGELVQKRLFVRDGEIIDPEKKRQYYQKQLDDPFIPVAKDILTPQISQIAKRINPDLEVGEYSQGVVINMANGFESLSETDLYCLHREIEQLIRDLYYQIESIYASRSEDQARPVPIEQEKIESGLRGFFESYHLSDDSQRRLLSLAKNIKSADEVSEKDWFLKGFAFTITLVIDKENGGAKLYVSPKVTSGMGVLESVGIVLIRDPDKRFSGEEEKAQDEFYSRVADNIQKKIEGVREGQYLPIVSERLREGNYD